MKYTHYFEPDSSVLSQVWYNEKDEKLVVQLHNGTMAGYEGVPLNVYQAFAKQEELGASAGSYWNLWIKPYFTGFSTADLVDEGDFEAAVENEPNYFIWDNSVQDESKATDVDLSQPVDMIGDFEREQIDNLNNAPAAELRTVNVEFTFEKGNEEFEGNLFVFAPDVDSARDVFLTVADALGYENASVQVASVYFN